MSQKYDKLKTLLQELFQLDQPDLDFGLYRVMHAKSGEVLQFLDKDLLPQVQAAFGQYKTADKAEIEKELAKVIAGIEAAGMNPSQSPKVADLRARIANDAVDIGALESEVYDHLFSFFRRYYSEGDFLAKRVYKPGVYAIPYEGEEVTLHWANKDQYYIKTSEYLRDYAFRLRTDDDKKPMRVHFRLADAAEGEHGNVKAAEGKERVFILAAPGESGRDPSTSSGQSFIAEEDGEQGKELVIRFEYRPATLTDWPDDVRTGKTKPPAQKDLSALAAKRVLAVTDASLAPWTTELGKPHITTSGEKAEYTRLEAHLKRYTARNTFDYFIHKDLGTFLRRELDFYIKNEVMHLDDVENESAPRVEQYLSKIKVIRKIAGKIIAFLAQLEDFQKKLWLKKKFVVETQWCITLDRIPAGLYQEIAANEAQREEWVRMFAIDEIEGDLTTPGYSVPPTVEFLNANPTLVLDTQHFSADFTARLLDALGDVDAQVGGVLIHSENFQALSLLSTRYRGLVQCVYIDPPYNTGSDGFRYKDTYQHSSWLSLCNDRLRAVWPLMKSSAWLAVSIDEREQHRLAGLLADSLTAEIAATVTVKMSHLSGMKMSHVDRKPPKIKEYLTLVPIDSEVARVVPQYEPAKWDEVFDRYTGFIEWDEARPHDHAAWRRVLVADAARSRGVDPNDANAFDRFRVDHATRIFRTAVNDSSAVRDTPNDGAFRRITTATGLEKLVFKREEVLLASNYMKPIGTDGELVPAQPLGDIWADIGINNLHNEGGVQFPNGKKPLKLLRRILDMCASEPESVVLDFFAGSGTTAHAVLEKNKDTGGKRQYIVIEMGEYFEAKLKTRVLRSVYSRDWLLDKPKGPGGHSHFAKCVRLESYEDALNNLETRRTDTQQLLLGTAEAQGADGLKEQYILRYMLDVETRGSQSLLNVQAFTDPTAYKLKVKRPGSDESREVNVDLLETFNWLIGLTVKHIATPQTFNAAFERDSEKRLRLKGRLKPDAAGPYWFRTATGTTPDGRKALVIWRKLTGEPEQDNLVLDDWFTKQGYSARDSEFDLIYVNGGNNLENLKTPDDLWKVRLIEEDFHRLMFEMEDS